MPESMPAWVSELLEDPPMEEVAPGGYTPLLLPAAIPAAGLVKQLLRHQLLPPEIRHGIEAQKSNISQPGAEDLPEEAQR
ncbi:hypothetical protein D8674_005023 [Pyrus ussuriensis x Pyrus communis]|uniref:Uncharacterized protein n=1 Tax=Pyrus ussuriensis x Pyrus communis TaxID=2448454 RepID=A0A5N5FQA3_9ROSA|nr:hypothetical protein D8674_005023 [Pyrus ussuriensis x Pyrus communis]